MSNQYNKENLRFKTQEEIVHIVMAANQSYVPILYTCLQSLINNVSSYRSYNIYIFHTNIELSSQEEVQKGLNRDNVRISFVDVTNYVAGYCLRGKLHITSETFYRFLILDIFKDYAKVIYLDCDTIILRDVAELYDLKTQNQLIAAVIDPDFVGQCNGANKDTMIYCRDVLQLKNPMSYFQAGVLVFYVKELNKITTAEKLLEISAKNIYKYSDQDILNVLCEGRVLYLNMAWNVLADCNYYRRQNVIKFAPQKVIDAYEQARKAPYIIHYAGGTKPWLNPTGDFAEEFWKVARQTLYYEQLIFSMCVGRKEKKSVIRHLEDFMRRWVKALLPPESRIRKEIGKLYWKYK